MPGLPTVIEAYAASGLLVKTLRYKKIKDYGLDSPDSGAKTA